MAGRSAWRLNLLAVLLFILFTVPASGWAHERDLHFTAVLAIAQLSGIPRGDAMRIATASYSLDENVETSPFPEDQAARRSLWWHTRSKMWHALPPYLKGDGEEEFLGRRLAELYGRAFQAQDPDTARVYFGQFLHYLADSHAHAGFHNILGHLCPRITTLCTGGHGLDIPGPDKDSQTEATLRNIITLTSRFYRTRFNIVLNPVNEAQLSAIKGSLRYAAPSGQETIASRERVVQQRMQQSLRAIGAQVDLPLWNRDTMAIGFDNDGRIKQGATEPRDYEGIVRSRAVTASSASRIAGQTAVTVVTDGTAPARRAAETTARAIAESMKPLGVKSAEVGGIDLANVRLNYVSDGGIDGQRTVAVGMEPDPAGRGGDAALSMAAFAAALALPNEVWWVNLSPEEPERIIDARLAPTDAGRVLLEADYLLKTVSDEAIRPDSASGTRYWRDYFQSSRTNFKSSSVVWRTWIVPGECRARALPARVEITDCRLEVRTNLEAASFATMLGGPNEVTLRREEIRLRETYVLPELRRAVNEDPRFAELRAVYRARALAQAYKERFSSEGALAHMIESLDLRELPPSRRRSPEQIWKQYYGDFARAGSEMKVPSPYGDPRTVVLHRGGIVLDDVTLSVAPEKELTAHLSPGSPGRGLLIFAAPPSRAGAQQRRFIEAAVEAFGNLGGEDKVSLGAQYLLPALAITGAREFDVVRADLQGHAAAADWVSRSVAMRTGSRLADPLEDAAAFAVYSRRRPREAFNTMTRQGPAGFRFGSYLFAALSYPKAGDPPPAILLGAFSEANTGDERARLTGFAQLASLAARVAPRATTRIVEDAVFDRFTQNAIRAARKDLVKTVDTLAVTSTENAWRLLQAVKDAHGGEWTLISELRNSNDLLARVRSRLAMAEKAGDIASGDLIVAARVAQTHWVTNPELASQRAEAILTRATSGGAKGPTLERVIAHLVPLIARSRPDGAIALADALQRPSTRLMAFSDLAMHVANPAAADMFLSQRVAEHTAGWLTPR